MDSLPKSRIKLFRPKSYLVSGGDGVIIRASTVTQGQGAALVRPYQPFCHSLSPVARGLLDPTSRRGTLAGSFGGQLLTWGFASSRFTGCLLGTGHGSYKSPEQRGEPQKLL